MPVDHYTLVCKLSRTFGWIVSLGDGQYFETKNLLSLPH